MRIAIITDIHFAGAAPGEFDVRTIVDEFVAFATNEKADLLLDLGDRIDDINLSADQVHARDLAQIFDRFPGPRVHLLGNHDVVNLTAEDHARTFGRPPGSHVIDLSELRVLAWEPTVLLDRRRGFPHARSELDWLVDTLMIDSRPAIIVSHIPVSGASMAGNYYFENNADFATYPDHAEIRRAVERTGRAAMWLSGHVHWNSVHHIANIWHVTVQSASERYTTMPDPACTYAMLEIDGVVARFQALGREPLTLELPFAASGTRPWPAPRQRVARN